MKILLCGDVHWCESSSILRGYGEKYSKRLENLISSVNWVENLAVETGCDEVIYLGDFFDKTELNAQEITALSEIRWSIKQHTFLVGNHEISRSDLLYSSTNALNVYGYSLVINKPCIRNCGNTELCFLPYITETVREPLEKYFGTPKQGSKRVILSHNDLKGFQMGAFLSQEGFELSDIEENCDLFINGHLHNGGMVSNKIFNIGNLTGQNFSEDAFKYDHVVYILDIDNCNVTAIENPFALKFYKIEDYNDLNLVKRHAVCTVKCDVDDAEHVRELLKNSNIIESRLVITQAPNKVYSEEVKKELIDVDHLKQFSEYILETLGDTDVVNQELMEVLK